MNGVAEDIFSLDVKADDLAEPTVPISGTISDLPKLQAVPAAPTVLAGLNSAFVSGEAPIMAHDLIRMLISLEDKDFKAWLSGTLIDPLNAKEVTDLLAIDLDTAIAQTDSRDGGVTPGPADLMIRDLGDISRILNTLQDPPDMNTWVAEVRTLISLLDRQAALRSRLVASGVAAAGKTIGDAFTAQRASAIQKAMAINLPDLQRAAASIAGSFGQNPYARINAIAVVPPAPATGGRFQSAGMESILSPVNDALGDANANALLARLRTNLNTLADNAAAFQQAKNRRVDLEAISQKLTAQKASGTSVFKLQTTWNDVANLTITQAGILNAAAKTLALQPGYDLLPAGQWFANKTITLTVKQGQRLALFDLGGLSDATRAGVTGGDTPAAKSTQVAATDLAAARVIQFPIYTLYHFKLGFGFAYSMVPDNKYQVDKVTAGSGSSATTQEYIDQTRNRDYNLLATANLIVFPWARHAFPWRPRFDGEIHPPFYYDLGAMIGFSVTSPSRDFFLGGAWFPPSSPVGVQLGWHIALRDYPPNGVDIRQPITDRVITLRQQRLNGFGAGLVFTTDFFGKVFAPIFKP